jgi:peroxiredoxin
MPRSSLRRWILGLAAVAAAAMPAPTARAEGQDLTGRMAPDLAFLAGLNGVGAGTTLSGLRGQVVWIKFWLRDCPICRRALPRAQELHERFGRSGLVVLTVVHKFGPEEVIGFMQENGYTFAVGSDPEGRLAARYGVQQRPVDYLVGIDGRVRSSNGLDEAALAEELAKWRLAELGRVPETLEDVRQAVWRGDYGEALRRAAARAGAEGATAEERAVHARVEELAGAKLANRVERARASIARGRRAEARAELDAVVEAFRGTVHEARAAAAREELLGPPAQGRGP